MKGSPSQLKRIITGNGLALTQAKWYIPPKVLGDLDHPLPRVFVSELEVDKLSSRAQAIIDRYASQPVKCLVACNSAFDA